MRAALLFVLTLLLPGLAHAASANEASARDADAMAIAGGVDGQAIYDRIAALTENPQTAYRLVGTQTHDNARAWITAQFEGLGLAPREFHHNCSGPNGVVVGGAVQRLPDGRSVPVPATSVMALLPGRDATRWAVIGGHYDTQESSPGALDNAAGVATVLTLAEAFLKHRDRLEASILFVAWDCEEWGVWGSREFVARLPEVERLFDVPAGSLRILMAAGLDMPGLNWPAQDTWATYHKGAFSVLHLRTSPVDTFGYKSAYGEYNVSNYTAAQLAGFRAYREVVKHAAYDLLAYPRQWVWVEDDTHGRTDHVPFVAHGIPGMRVHGPSDEEYPPYHGPSDTMPVLEQSAGGRELLLQGLEAAARVTAVTAALTTLAGNFDEGGSEPAPGGSGGVRTPGPDVPEFIAAFGLAGLALALHRRR